MATDVPACAEKIFFSVDGNSNLGTGIIGILFQANRSMIDNVYVSKMSGTGVVVRGTATWSNV